MTERYQILSLLGEGGMGRVFLARDMEKDKAVALKFLPRDFEASALIGLKNEVRLLSQFSHPNLIRFFDFAEAAGLPFQNETLMGPFLSMEYVNGVSLDHALSKRRPEDVLDLFVQTARGLHFLHRRGILHRDLKTSHVLVSQEGRVTLIDFGLSLSAAEPHRPIGGTPAYMAPETFAGLYDAQSDLFSLGTVFHEALAGRSDLPGYFAELLDRLRNREPAKRPPTALSLLRWLNRHHHPPFSISIDEARSSILEKVPWVTRNEETRLEEMIDHGNRLILITGPTGVGRTRFLREMRLRMQLRGLSTEGYEDLHLLSPGRLQELRIALRTRRRENPNALILADYDSDLIASELENVLSDPWIQKSSQVLSLGDFSPEQSHTWIRRAAMDFENPISIEKEDRIAKASGGRPLLLFQLLSGGEESTNLKESCRRRLQNLSDEDQKLLALVLVLPSPQEKQMTLLEAERILQRDLSRLRDFLMHPSLFTIYHQALSPSWIQKAHATWLKTATDPALILHHAVGAGDFETALNIKEKALDALFRNGEFERILGFCRTLLDHARDDADRFVLYAHEAPIYYRQGRFEDSLKAYDLWHRFRPDEGTGLKDLRLQLHRGQVFLTWGRNQESRECLKRCLSLGDSRVHPHHRPFHAQAHLLLATLDEKENRWQQAGKELESARELAGSSTDLLSEIEYRTGRLEQHAERFPEAESRFRKALGLCRDLGNAQSTATVLDAFAMLRRSEGRLKEAVEIEQEALILSEKGGETLQTGRLRENLGLLWMDLADYGKAEREMNEAQDVLEVLGDDQDRSLVSKHLTALRTLLGRTSVPDRPQPPQPWQALLEGNDLTKIVSEVRSMEAPETRLQMYRALAERVNREGAPRLSLAFLLAARNEWEGILKKQPEEVRMDLNERKDIKALEESLAALIGPASPTLPNVSQPKSRISEENFRRFCEITRQLVQRRSPQEILERMMDAAIELTGAERGFILLKEDESAEGPVKGYEVKAARHVHQRNLGHDEFKLSLSVVRETLVKGAPILTDDAQLDPRFKEKKSIAQLGLKSILVAPLEIEGEVTGAIYLDHRYRPDCFGDEAVLLLTAFAAQSSLVLQNARILEELAQARQRLEIQVETLSTELSKRRNELKYGYEEMIGQSPSMMKVFELLDRITDTKVPVWIFGESGTGKELVARSLHFNSARAKKPFVAENVSAIPETLLESELFGYKKGSFTHADRDHTGLFEQANGGTLFLDEIGDMSLAMQAKLLRVLQEGEVRPLGSTKKIPVDVRLVAASNKDLRKMVKDGSFRQDLFFRINGLTIALPPLRDRKDDIPLLAKGLVEKLASALNLAVSEISPEALTLLLNHDWPGNIRELEATLRNALIFAQGKPIDVDALRANEGLFAPPSRGKKIAIVPVQEATHWDEGKMERQMMMEALRKHRLDKKAAAGDLGISLKTLYLRMAAHGIPKKKTVLAGYLGLRAS